MMDRATADGLLEIYGGIIEIGAIAAAWALYDWRAGAVTFFSLWALKVNLRNNQRSAERSAERRAEP